MPYISRETVDGYLASNMGHLEEYTWLQDSDTGFLEGAIWISCCRLWQNPFSECTKNCCRPVASASQKWCITLGHSHWSPLLRELNGPTHVRWWPSMGVPITSLDFMWYVRSTPEQLHIKMSMILSHLGMERILSGGWWRHWVSSCWKIENGTLHFRTTFCQMMMRMLAMAIQQPLGKATQPTPVNE